MLLILFPILAPIAALIGYLNPELIAPLKGAIVPLLVVVMSCMGITLKPEDFIKIRAYRGAMVLGIVLQFTVMPIVALFVAALLKLDQEYTTGLVLVGSVAGGTSSNVMAYLAQGNVALSVSMTAISTVMSVLMTPFIMSVALGETVPVPAKDMIMSLVQIILLPVSFGVLLNHYAGHYLRPLQAYLAPIATAIILVIIAIVVSLNADSLGIAILTVGAATLLHNVSGLLLGYLGPRLLGFDRVVSRTIAIEVGMQNSGLATALALKLFPPAVALPGAIFSVWLNITGSLFASFSIWLESRKEPY